MDLSEDTIIVTNKDSREKLGDEVPGFWEEIGSDSEYMVYKLVPNHDDGRVDRAERKNDTPYGTIIQCLSGKMN